MSIDDGSADFELDDLAVSLGAVVGEARSDGGLVTVKVDNRGRVAEVRLDSQVSGVSAERLAEAITTVCAEAFNNRLDRLADVIADYGRTRGLPFGVLDYLHTSVDRLR